jgi:Heparinase II/III-like protein/Heparinase II/III N-terminus
LGYYTGRALQLSPGDVAKVAARRALRTARQWLYRFGQGRPSVPEDILLTALQPFPQAWCDVSRRKGTVAALLEADGAACRAWSRAERALSRTFRLFGHEVCFGAGGRVQWSVDPVTGHPFPLEPWTNLDLFSGAGDPKYPWQLGRLESVVALGQGYWLGIAPEERRRFAEEFVSITTDFLRENPAGMGIQWASPMEVSLRAANIAQALYMFRDAPEVGEPGFLLTTLRALAEHVAFVEANLEDRCVVPNNHLIADYVGLLTVGTLFPDLPAAGRQVALAIAGIEEQVALQVHADGVSFEGSTAYHRLVAELGLLGLLFARASGNELRGDVVRRIHGLARVAASWCSEKGWAPQLGDNDSGRAFAVTDRPSLEHGYLADLAAVLFLDPSLRRAREQPCDEVLWLFGEEGMRTWAALPPQWAPQSFSSKEGGIHVLRGAGAVVTLSAGPQGERGAGSHSHNDKLSFELHLEGEPVIVDPGSPVYASDPATRNAYRSTSAHNTIELNGEEQVPFDPARLFSLPEGTHARVESFESTAEVERIVAVHYGYARLEPPVTMRRVLELHTCERALLIEDVLEGEGTRLLRMHLQFPDCEVRLRGPKGQERLRAMPLMHGAVPDESLAIELGSRDVPRAVILLEAGWEVALEEHDWSPGYGERRSAFRVAMRRVRTLPVRLRWVVLFGERVLYT